MALPDSGYEQHLADLATAWIEDHPTASLKVLLATGALELFAACGRCVGHDACRWVHAMNPEDIPECVPVYRLVTEENRDGE